CLLQRPEHHSRNERPSVAAPHEGGERAPDEDLDYDRCRADPHRTSEEDRDRDRQETCERRPAAGGVKGATGVVSLQLLPDLVRVRPPEREHAEAGVLLCCRRVAHGTSSSRWSRPGA